MKRAALALLFCLLAFAASAQTVTVIGPITPGNVPQFSSTTIIKDSGVPGGTGAFANPTGAVGLTVVNGAALTAMRSDAAPPLSSAVQSALTGTSGRLLIGTGGFGFTAIALGGDCTFTSPNITCTKVNGVSYGSSPATDTVPVVTSANTTTYTALPNCTVGTLNYATATHLFSCGATGSGTVTSVTCFGTAITTSGTCVTAAAKSDEQAGTSAVLATTPSQQQQHDSAAKATVAFTGSGTNGAQTIQSSYNVSGVSRVGTGLYTVTFSTAFAAATYVCNSSSEAGGGTTTATSSTINPGSRTTTTVQIQFLTGGGTGADPTSGFLTCHGRQ